MISGQWFCRKSIKQRLHKPLGAAPNYYIFLSRNLCCSYADFPPSSRNVGYQAKTQHCLWDRVTHEVCCFCLFSATIFRFFKSVRITENFTLSEFFLLSRSLEDYVFVTLSKRWSFLFFTSQNIPQFTRVLMFYKIGCA